MFLSRPGPGHLSPFLGGALVSSSLFSRLPLLLLLPSSFLQSCCSRSLQIRLTELPLQSSPIKNQPIIQGPVAQLKLRSEFAWLFSGECLALLPQQQPCEPLPPPQLCCPGYQPVPRDTPQVKGVFAVKAVRPSPNIRLRSDHLPSVCLQQQTRP